MRKREVAQIEAAEIDRRLSDPELCENTAVARSALEPTATGPIISRASRGNGRAVVKGERYT